MTGKLRLVQAYVKLMSIPESESGLRTLSLSWVKNHEIRMFEQPSPDAADAPLFWLELVDHDARRSVNSCCCYDIDAAVVAFDAFVEQASAAPDEPPLVPGNENQL